MRYIINKNEAIRSVKVIKSILELTRPVFQNYSLSMIKQEYARLMGYRTWNELITFSENEKQPIIALNEIKTEGLNLFIEIFGKSSLIRILNNQQYPVPDMFLSFNKKTINYLKYIDQLPQRHMDYITTSRCFFHRLLAYFDNDGVHLSEYALKVYNNECVFNVSDVEKDAINQWIKHPRGIMSIGAVPGRGKSLFAEVYVIRKLVKNNKKVALLKYHEKYQNRNQYSFLYDMPIINETQISQYDVVYIDDLYEPLKPEILQKLRQSKTALIATYQDDHKFNTPLIASSRILGTEPNIYLGW